MAKKETYVGIDQDNGYIRAARLGLEHHKSRSAKAEEFRLLETYEVEGDFSQDKALFDALRQFREKMSLSSSELIVTCLSGKQTFAAEMNVKKLPDEEMKSMLKLELRKTMPFEPSAAIFDFAWLPVAPDTPQEKGVPIIVTASTNAALTKHLNVYERAGIKPQIVDILPVAVSNAFWAIHRENMESNQTYVIMHVGSETCTLVIDGDRSPFFNRSFSFDINGIANLPTGSPEAALQMNILSDELNKSLTYYRNTFKNDNISTITLMGSHASHPSFETLGRKTGLSVEPSQTAQVVGRAKPPAAGKFDLAVALAMQAA
ncbi:MAG: pilus assembly protein PilM [Chitinispirillales bacterium]|nr:pilus assembly protein PilM [Chitinispirillales bacterium]